MIEHEPLLIEGKSKAYAGHWKLCGETLTWELEGKTFSIESDGDLASNVVRFLHTLGKRVFHDEMKLKACLTCQHFQMSGMAREMGRGQIGVCSVHQDGVQICHLCDDYRKCEIKI